MKTMKMNRALSPLVACMILAAAALPAAAQQTGGPQSALQTRIVRDFDVLAQKFAGLAGAMNGKYDWRPGEGVRSVNVVFNHIITENRMLLNLLSGAAPQGAQQQPAITDPAQVQEALRTTYASLRQAVAGMSDNDWNATVQFYGRETTKQVAVLSMLLAQHEHLGQSIAYARTNGVAPPWSR